MKRIFIDSSVFFSAVYSSKGYSRDLILMGVREEIKLVVSQVVLLETRRNLAEFSPEHVSHLDTIESNTPLEIVHITKNEILAAAEHVVLKDAPIVAAARKGRIDLLVTMDKKHLLNNPQVLEYVGVNVVTPKEAVELIQKRV